jgi:flagellar biosynthesis protein FlhG
MNQKTTIIPIASGKGGVGKSMLAANLAITLAAMGHSTVAADLDLGGSNLHTVLGLPNKYPGIGDYLKGSQTSLQNLLIPTRNANLKFLPGDGRIPFMANIPYLQRLQLMKELCRIPARYLLLDLGAGSSFNTLNLFSLARRAMIVTTFDPPAIMNFLVFLRNFQYRLITSLVKPHDQELFDRLVEAFRSHANSKPLTVDRLLHMIAERDQMLAARVRKVCGEFEPRLVFNMGDGTEELSIWPGLQRTMKKNLSMEAACFGFVFYDQAARRAVQRQTTLVEGYPDSRTAKCVKALAKRITEQWERPTASFSEKVLSEETRAIG